jgi:hypothetical protein
MFRHSHKIKTQQLNSTAAFLYVSEGEIIFGYMSEGEVNLWKGKSLELICRLQQQIAFPFLFKSPINYPFR